MKLGNLNIIWFSAPSTSQSPGHESGILVCWDKKYISFSLNCGHVSKTWSKTTKCCLGAGLQRLKD